MDQQPPASLDISKIPITSKPDSGFRGLGNKPKNDEPSNIARRQVLKLGLAAGLTASAALTSIAAGSYLISTTSALEQATPSPSPTDTQTLKTEIKTPTKTATPSPTTPPTESPSPTAAEKPKPTETPAPIEKPIFYPDELEYDEVKEYIGKLLNTHDSVLSESLFMTELAQFSPEKRREILQAIAHAHAEVIHEYYGDTEAIIGLDPGHGGSEVGAAATGNGVTIAEKDVNWDLAQLVAEDLKKISHGRYAIIMLRPQNPQDKDLDHDGFISPVERIQKRKALLMKMEKELRPNEKERGKNIVFLSLHFNGSQDPNQKGAETYYPNKIATSDDKYRESSKNLAKKIQEKIVNAIRQNGYNVFDRGAKEDPDQNMPVGNTGQVGPYLVLGSPRLSNVLRN